MPSGTFDENNQRPPPNPDWNIFKMFMIMTLVIVMIRVLFFNSGDAGREVAISEIYTLIEKQQVEEVLIVANQGIIRANLKDKKIIWAYIVDPKEFEKFAFSKGVKIRVDYASTSFRDFILPLLSIILPVILVIWIFRRVFSRAGGGSLDYFKKHKGMVVDKEIQTRFSDVAGCDEIIEQARGLIKFITRRKALKRAGLHCPRGLLFIGSPGTGKTLLARAIAGEANEHTSVTFISVSGSDFIEMLVGVGSARVKDIFAVARQKAPSIIFIDEIDAVAIRRDGGSGAHDERNQTLNSILSEMDGFNEDDSVTVIAATNRPDILDPALLRPGRFDEKLYFPAPDLKGREAILRVHTKNKNLAADIDLAKLARMAPPGFTGADLQNVVNRAGQLVAQRIMDDPANPEKKICSEEVIITQNDFEKSLDEEIMGRERKSVILSETDKRITAYHEIGHTIVALNFSNGDPFERVTIVPRGPSLGVTLQIPKEDRRLYTKEYLLQRLAVCMGGRVGEELIGTETSGAMDDFKKATEIAQMMVAEFGMSEEIGKVVYGRRPEFLKGAEVLNCSPDMQLAIEKETKRLTDEAYKKAKDILEEKRDQVEKLAKALMERETLNRQEVLDLLGLEHYPPT